MLSLSQVVGTTVYPWVSPEWPVSKTLSGSPLTIEGSVVSHFSFVIRKQSQLKTYLGNKVSEDVALNRQAVRLRVDSVTQDGKQLTIQQTIDIFQKYIDATSSGVKLTVNGNYLDIWAHENIASSLQSREQGVTTPLTPGTGLRFVTTGATPVADAVHVTKAIQNDAFQGKANVNVEEGMLDFARKYQALCARQDAVTGGPAKQAQDDDDEWD